jgi:hypothetical protein
MMNLAIYRSSIVPMPTRKAELKPCYVLEQPGYPEIPQSENAQVRPISREVDLAWLAGIIDGEGNIHNSVQVKDDNAYFVPKLRITNTDLRMIKKVSEIYVREDIVFFYALNSVKRYKNKKDTWRNQMEITIASQGGIKKLLSLVLPYLVNKRRMAELMIETVKWVQAQPYRGRNSVEGKNYCQRSEFKRFHEEMKVEMAWHIDPSTTIRRARSVISW